MAELSPAIVADKGRASSRKTRRRRKKTSLTVVAAAAATTTTPSLFLMQRLFDTSKEVFACSSSGFVLPPDTVARLSALLSMYRALPCLQYSKVAIFVPAVRFDAFSGRTLDDLMNMSASCT